ncbi:MAG TPA: hypothetical protein VNZ49_00055 [Bacteroidia bacterium]|jgi:hypothetical protein|nr:hypothetical protein [Bacteroidia bacterium]
MSRKLKITGFILAMLISGFFREILFVNMNAVLYYKYFQPGEATHLFHENFRFLTAFSYKTLYISKWFITLGFVFLFWFIQKKFIFFLFTEKKAVFWLGMLYLSLLLLAGISFGTGWLLGNLEQGYRFSRIFTGLLESPVPCMILIPLTYFYKKQTHI